MFVTEGRDHEVVVDFVDDLIDHNGTAKQINQVSCDMSPAFILGVEKNLPNADIVFDRFHVIKVLNDAVDKVRKAEVAKNPILGNF